MHHISSQDEELEEMKSRLFDSLGGKPIVKKRRSGEKMCGFGKQKLHSSRWSQTPYPNRGLRLSGIKIVLKTMAQYAHISDFND